MLELKKTQMSLLSSSHLTSLLKNHPHLWLGDSTKSVFTIWAPGHIWKCFLCHFCNTENCFPSFPISLKTCRETAGNNLLGTSGCTRGMEGLIRRGRKEVILIALRVAGADIWRSPLVSISVAARKAWAKTSGRGRSPAQLPHANEGVCMTARNHFSSIQVCS